ncbi:hypothetical protein IJG14_03510 [bacterium]|nr:hypothetical protein [bacterium]
MTNICNGTNENTADSQININSDNLPQDNNTKFIKVSKKIIVLILIVMFSILGYVGNKVYYKNFYKTIKLPDKKYNTDIVEFTIPSKWIPIGKELYNPKSIPNLLTFFVAGINPKEEIEFQFFSTQFETQKFQDISNTQELNKFSAENYLTNVIKKLSPKAQNIELEKIITISGKETNEAEDYIEKYNKLYEDINPVTTKGKSWLENFEVQPVKYLFSYTEGKDKYYQLLEGRFVFFIQCFSKAIDENTPIHTAIQFTKCEDLFSYKAKQNLFKKNMHKYKVFKKSIKINKTWLDYTNDERMQLLENLSYITTESLQGGAKFNPEAFKNTIYYIEYLDNNSKTALEKMDSKNFITLVKKIFE